MAFYLHGIRLPHRKHTGKKAVASMPPPASVTIPMSMHIGVPSKPLVKVGDTVQVGDIVGTAAEGKLSMPVHASIAGKVAEVTDKYVVIRA